MNMNASNTLKTMVLGLTLQLVCFSAFAYNTFGRWSGNSVTMRAARGSFPVGNAYRTALGTVVSRWNANPSNFYFIQTYDDTAVAFNNGQNEVWFSASSSYNPAVTFWWTNWLTGRIVEADVVFYNGEAYTTSMSKTSLWTYGGAYRPFETTAIHEYGHVMGLGHEADEYNIMGQDWTHLSLNGQTTRSYSGEDGNDGAVALYGLWSGGQIEDVGVVHQMYSGFSGEYSTHGMTKVFNSSGAELTYTTFNGQRRYNVSKGQTVRVQFTYENNGETTKSPHVGFYVSSDSTINTADTRIATGSMTLSRDSVLTTTHTIVIPTWVTSGTTYYLGAYVDWDSLISENTEANNAAYHIVRVN